MKASNLPMEISVPDLIDQQLRSNESFLTSPRLAFGHWTAADLPPSRAVCVRLPMHWTLRNSTANSSARVRRREVGMTIGCIFALCSKSLRLSSG